MFSGYSNAVSAADAAASERLTFIRRTYGLLLAAVLAFIGLEVALFQSGLNVTITNALLSSRGAWLGVMVLFMIGSYVGQRLAMQANNVPLQYAGLGLMVIIYAVIFLPILTIAQMKTGDNSLAAKAGLLTLVIFAGLTLSVFISGRDFSFMGSALTVLSFAAFGVVLVSMFMGGMGAGLGIWFAFAMVALMCGYIIYYTSAVMHQFHTSQYVGAAVALFAAVMTLFYYILMIFMSRGNNND